MKKLIATCLILAVINGCAPFNARLSVFEYNSYTIMPPNSSTQVVWNVSNDDGTRSYGNKNIVITDQMLNVYKSPTTNSSNNVPIDFSIPLVK